MLYSLQDITLVPAAVSEISSRSQCNPHADDFGMLPLFVAPMSSVIDDKNWRIFSRNYAEPPHFVGEDEKVVNSMITEGCEIEGTVENSVLSNGVKVEKGAIVKDAVIMSGAVIKANAKVIYSIIDSNTVISSGAVVGEDKSTAKGIAIVGSDLTLAENLVVEAGAMVNSDYGDGVSVNEN
jgi:glucose-1-phosphate adenylyltransferase